METTGPTPTGGHVFFVVFFFFFNKMAELQLFLQRVTQGSFSQSSLTIQLLFVYKKIFEAFYTDIREDRS